ncbi:hypothetical protein BT69DRAFT_1394053 [Atractiella rhizophila]|nr:hypothetical protein BT69DRAFT_1394053 [Atractiella rhizophila]
MLALCLRYQDAIENYVDQCGLDSQRLRKAEWDGVEAVATWLESFRNATIEMSTTSSPSLSSTLGMYYGLMGEIKEFITTMPKTIPKEFRDGLVNAHVKLSTYNAVLDNSPYPLWSVCE